MPGPADATQNCKVTYEGWPKDLEKEILSDTSSDAYRAGVDELAELLTSVVDEPSKVTLVIALLFVESVMQREPQIPFTAQRGSGLVGARTVPREDGTVDVIVPAEFLGAKDSLGGIKYNAAGAPASDPVGVQLMRRTIAHEAQHVVMAQRGSDWRAYEALKVSPEAAKHHYGAAAKMCDEHRAEYNAIQLTSSNPPAAGDVLDVLCHLAKDLAAANDQYQANSADPEAVRELRDQVYMACMQFWTNVAYWTAQFRHGDTIADVPAEISHLEVWDRYVGGTWGEMAQALSLLPVADLTTAPDVLREAASRVATAVENSLNHIGFRHVDGANGVEFYIDRHDFPSARR